MDITFVTYFFNIGRKEDINLPSFDKYLEWIEQLLNLPLNFYFITTEEIRSKLRFKSAEKIHFKIVPDVPGMEKIPLAKAAWSKYNTNNPLKDTAEFAILMHAKFPSLLMAINDNPFNTKYFAWIDAGILKVATHPERLMEMKPSDRIKCMMINYISDNEVKDPKFINVCGYKIAGGFFSGNKTNMKYLSREIIKLGDTHLSEGRYGLEQEYIAIIYKQNPDIFDPYYGDFCDLFCNYEKMVHNKWLAERVLARANNHNDTKEAHRVIHYLNRS